MDAHSFSNLYRQYFISRRDNFFQQTCRGSRVAVVCLTQNILNLSEELGEAQPGSKTKSFCGNLAIKIAHQQNEHEDEGQARSGGGENRERQDGKIL